MHLLYFGYERAVSRRGISVTIDNLIATGQISECRRSLGGYTRTNLRRSRVGVAINWNGAHGISAGLGIESTDGFDGMLRSRSASIAKIDGFRVRGGTGIQYIRT